MDGRTDDGRTADHGHPLSSNCEPGGSGELKKTKKKNMYSSGVQADIHFMDMFS